MIEANANKAHVYLEEGITKSEVNLKKDASVFLKKLENPGLPEYHRLFYIRSQICMHKKPERPI